MSTRAVREFDIAIIGGGLVGLLSAYWLLGRTRKIAVFDSAPRMASESSWAGGGILSPLYPWRYPEPVNWLAARSRVLYPTLVKELEESAGIDPQYVKSGLLLSKADVNSSAEKWLAENNENVESANAKQTQRLESGEYYFLPEIAQIRNPVLAKALIRALEENDVQFFNNAEVLEILPNTSDVIFKTKERHFCSEKIVISAGAWSSRFLRQLGVAYDIKPVRGQMLLYRAPQDFMSAILLSNSQYIIPRKDGLILVGSTMEDVGFQKTVTKEAYEDLTAFAVKISASFGKFPLITQWSGLRPGSPHGVPVISRHPEYEQVYFNCGHFRNGVVMAPASAELLANLMLNQASLLDSTPYQANKLKKQYDNNNLNSPEYA